MEHRAHNMKHNYLTTGPLQTQKLGKQLAERILQSSLQKKALILGLEGDLGGGKTTFLQGFAKGLGIKEKILSPTFVIMKKFHVPYSMFHDFYHIDCYRIKKSKEISGLGWKDIINNPGNIVAVEWAERIKTILPKDTLFFKFEFIDKKSRKIMVRFKNGFQNKEITCY